MAIGGEAFGSAIGGFFGGPKLKRIELNPYLNDAINEQAIGLRGLRKTAGDAGAKYAAAVDASTPQVQAVANENLALLGRLANQGAAFDPTDTYERIRGGNIASLADQFVNLATYGQQADKSALAARGYGGRGPGSFESTIRADRISRNIAPVLNTIFGNLGADAAGLNQNRLANLAATTGIARERLGLPGYADSRALLPYQAQAGMLGNEIGMSGMIADATKANTAGYEQTQNKWANFFQQMGRATDQVADTAISLYGGGMLGGGGGMGGILGGGGGGGGATAAPAPAIRSFSMQPLGSSYPGPWASGYQF